jgi:predicted metal-dependent phosphoesterase TrpH
MGGQFSWGQAMADLRGMGLESIEAYYPDHSAKETAYFLDICGSLDMAPTGGSDYHGDCKPRCKLGTAWGNLCVPDDALDKLMEKLPK